MPRKSFLLATGHHMEYELLSRGTVDPRKPTPFVVSVSGRDQFHVNGFSQRLLSENWVVAMAIRPQSAPLLFQGNGTQGDGVWHLHELCKHLLKEYAVSKGRFLLVGVSNGGSSVLRLASLWPELCCGVIVATGSLQGLVELPGACRQMQGLPVDMYVGTKDECGFYQPMVSLRDHFKSCGHKPVAELTVFKDAGHVCSPLIDDFLIHGKIGLIFLHAGAVTSGQAMSGPSRASRPSEKIVASLASFAKELGLNCTRAADGSLKVETVASTQGSGGPGGLLMTMQLPRLPKGVFLPPDTAKFKLGDSVEVWSNSRQHWDSGTVARVAEGEEGGVQVIYEDERGKVSKMIPWAVTSEYLRKPASGDTRIPSVEGYSVGDAVAIWSASLKRWVKDGQISLITREQGVTVVYCDGSLSKIVPLENVAEYLRRPGAVGDTSPQPNHLPTAPSRPLVLPVAASGSSRPSSASRSPPNDTSPWPYSREASQYFPSGQDETTPSRPLGSSPAQAYSASPPTNSSPVAVTTPPLASAVTREAAQVATQVTAPATAPTVAQSGPQATGLLALYPLRCRVSIWSSSLGKWFDDGQVEKVGEEGVTVVYAGQSMQKLVLPDHTSQFLRRIIS